MGAQKGKVLGGWAPRTCFSGFSNHGDPWNVPKDRVVVFPFLTWPEING